MKNVTKRELSKEMSNKIGMTTQQNAKAIEAFLSVVKEKAKEGRSTELRGFGSFRVVTRKARQARDIKNNKNISIPEKRVLKLKPSFDID